MYHIFRTKIVPATIILIGVVIALFLGGVKEKNGKNKFLGLITSGKSDPFLAFERGGSLDDLGVTKKTNTQGESSHNLSDILGNLYLSELAKRNPNAGYAETFSLPAEETLNSLAADQISKGLVIDLYTAKDLRVGGSGWEAEEKYLKNISSVTQKNFSSFKKTLEEILTAWIEKQNPTLIEDYVTRAGNQTADLLAIEVPKNLVTLHLSLLNLWQRKIAVYGALIDVENDPLKTYVALTSIESVILENDLVQKEIEEIYKKLSS